MSGEGPLVAVLTQVNAVTVMVGNKVVLLFLVAMAAALAVVGVIIILVAVVLFIGVFLAVSRAALPQQVVEAEVLVATPEPAAVMELN